MTTKTTGAELRAFLADEEYWPRDAWYEEAAVHVDGLEVGDDTDLSALADAAEVKIEGGYVYLDVYANQSQSLESFFRRWRKQSDTAWLSVECPKDKSEAVRAAVEAAGGKVVS